LAHTNRRRVLIVDDDRDSAEELRIFLEERGFSVDVAANGRVALDLLLANQASEPAVVLLDIGMPVMDGWELLAVMRSYLRLRDIPVVIMTAQDVDDLTRTVVNGLFKKPVEPEAVLDTVRRVVCGVLG
jgi:two-component system, sensor histidine kinase and response regulator